MFSRNILVSFFDLKTPIRHTKHLRCFSENLSSTNTPEKKTSISIIKSKLPYIRSNLKAKNKNFAGLKKHFVPSFKEWDNSVYAYKEQTIRTLPSNDKMTFSLIKSYLNFYNTKVEKTARSIRARRRRIRSSTNKTLVGKPNFKHTNSNLVIIIHYYNRRFRYYLNKINNANSADNTLQYQEYKMFIKNIKSKLLKIKTLMSRHHTSILNTFNLKRNFFLKDLEKTYLTDITKKFFQKEINSLLIRQIIFIQKSRVNKPFLLPLLGLLETIYNKKVILNFINIKYIFNSASIISEGIITKLRKRTNKPLRVLRSSLNMFKVPTINRLALYDDMFNKKVKPQNETLKELLFYNNKKVAKDIIDNLIDKKPTNYYLINRTPDDKYLNKYNLNKVIELLKSKFTSGVRFEMAGRLTRRNIAQRSLYKLVYIGNIKNTDSSHKGLSTTLLRGYAKSNVQFKQSKSKRRIGSFGLKTWISSSK